MTRSRRAGTGSCTFEKGLCDWAQADRKLWVRGTSTPSSSTGASRAQSGSYFVYLETSSPSSSGWQSSLVHPVKPGSKSVTFHYHMHGATMGTLRLDAYASGRWRTLWSKSGQQQRKQGDSFTQAKARPTAAATLPHAREPRMLLRCGSARAQRGTIVSLKAPARRRSTCPAAWPR